MRKFVRNKITGRFLTADGMWTEDPVKAWQFTNQREADPLIGKAGTTEPLEIYYSFHESWGTDEFDFAFPIIPATKKTEPVVGPAEEVPGEELIILLVEDEASDIALFHYAVKAAPLNINLQAVPNGQRGMDYLLGRDKYGDRRRHPLPDLILLDLLMYNLNGVEFLEWCSKTNECKNVPVIVWTGTIKGDEMQREALAGGARGVLLKPHGTGELQAQVRHIYELGVEFKHKATGR